MPKVIINPLKGLYQTGGTGVVVESAGLEGLAYGNTKSAIGAGGHVVDWEITQPAGTVLTDVGVVTTTATIGASNIVISVGESSTDQDILCKCYLCFIECCCYRKFNPSFICFTGSR